MTSLRPQRAWLIALCAASGCTSSPATQVVTGRIDTAQGAVAVRAVVDNTVATAAEVHSDGSFTLSLPAGARYQLEVLTSNGVKHLVTRDGTSLRGLSFKVCEPVPPFDVGHVGAPGKGCSDPSDPNCKCDPATDPTCGAPCDPNDPKCPPPPCKDPSDPNCKPPPGGCDPSTDPNCKPPPPPPCDPNKDPSCKPPPGCDPSTDPNCKPPPPPPCDPSKDPNCKPPPGGCDPKDPNCPPSPCKDPADPSCKCNDPTTPGCAPPCPDPTDPKSCKDPCVEDPASCGCKLDEPNCWPEPPKCDPNDACKPDGSVVPDHPPGDFGCKESGA
jgi:hypothetical protein